jgi:hypothetical protein
MENKFISIDEMKEKLDTFGSTQIWQSLEKLGNWKERVAYRQLFFLAGGNLDDDRVPG